MAEREFWNVSRSWCGHNTPTAITAINPTGWHLVSTSVGVHRKGVETPLERPGGASYWTDSLMAACNTWSTLFTHRQRFGTCCFGELNSGHLHVWIPVWHNHIMSTPDLCTELHGVGPQHMPMDSCHLGYLKYLTVHYSWLLLQHPFSEVSLNSQTAYIIFQKLSSEAPRIIRHFG